MVIALAVAAASGTAFVLTERLSASPMLDVKLFGSTGFAAATVIALVSFLPSSASSSC